MQLSGLTATMNTDRVERAEGHIYRRSLDIGQTVVAFRNIGTITFQDGRNSPGPIIVALILAVIGLGMFSASRGVGAMIVLAATALVIWALRRSPDLFLSIGTCDGRRTNIISKDKSGLLNLQDFLRDKMDDEESTGTIEISPNKVTYSINVHGGVAIGDRAQAVGTDGVIHNRGAQDVE